MIFRNIVKIIWALFLPSIFFVEILTKVLTEIKIPMAIESQFFGEDNTAQKRQ